MMGLDWRGRDVRQEDFFAYAAPWRIDFSGNKSSFHGANPTAKRCYQKAHGS